MERQREEQTLGELFGELSREMSGLVRQEVALAKIEMSRSASQTGKHVGLIAAGGALAYAGLLAIEGALVVLLAQVLPLWLSALLIGLLVIGTGYFLIQQGLSALRKADLMPRRTMETLKEDAQWAKQQIR